MRYMRYMLAHGIPTIKLKDTKSNDILGSFDAVISGCSGAADCSSGAAGSEGNWGGFAWLFWKVSNCSGVSFTV